MLNFLERLVNGNGSIILNNAIIIIMAKKILMEINREI